MTCADFQFGGTAFANQFDDSGTEKWSVDDHLAELLWEWDSNWSDSIEQSVSGLLDRVLDEAFKYSPDKQQRRWWSDGVAELTVTKRSESCFLLIGAAWIDAGWVAPFEIEVHYRDRCSHEFERMIVRCGDTDADRRHKTKITRRMLDWPLMVREIIENRPSHDVYWAMAIELTPPKAS